MVRMLLRRFGMSMGAARVLEVPDPETGEPHSTPLNVLDLDGTSYLVSARGDSRWVRHLRAGGSGRLVHGKSSEEFTAVELPEAERPPIIRAYVKEFWKDSKGLFEVSGPDTSIEQVAEIAPQHPVFRVEPAARGQR